MEAYFNELSCSPLCKDESEAESRALDFASLLKELVDKLNVKNVRCPDGGSHDVRLCENLSVAELASNPKNIRKPAFQLLLKMLIRPFFQEDSAEEDKFINNKYLLEVPNELGVLEKKDAYGLSAAFLNRSFGVNLSSSDYWIRNKVYSLIENVGGKSNKCSVLSIVEKDDIDGTEFFNWKVKNMKMVYPKCNITPSEKVCKLSSDHHGNDSLVSFARLKLFPMDYVKEIITSTRYNPFSKSFVKSVDEKNFRLHVVLFWEQEGFGMVVQTTAENKLQLHQMADDLERKFGNH